jgi:hypothetical protein
VSELSSPVAFERARFLELNFLPATPIQKQTSNDVHGSAFNQVD